MMAKLYIFGLLFFSFNGLSAQNLQFGTTKLIDSKSDTVPAGKIWKIECFVYSQPIAQCPNSGAPKVNISDSIILNGKPMMVRAQRFSAMYENTWDDYGWNTEFFLWEQKTPMWLPAGSTLSVGSGVRYISVLEFKESP